MWKIEVLVINKSWKMKLFPIAFAVLLFQVNLKSVESIFGTPIAIPGTGAFTANMVTYTIKATANLVNLLMALSQCSSQPTSADPLIASNLAALCKIRTNLVTYLVNPNVLNPFQQIQYIVHSSDRSFPSLKSRLQTACDNFNLFFNQSAVPITAFPNGSQIIQNLSLATSNLCNLLNSSIDQVSANRLTTIPFNLILNYQIVITLQIQNLSSTLSNIGKNVFSQAYVFATLDPRIRSLNSTAVVSSTNSTIWSAWSGFKTYFNNSILSLVSKKKSLAAITSNYIASSRNLLSIWNGFYRQEC
jgi:hypothetical protein